MHHLTHKIKETNQIIKVKELRPTIYFSTSLKEQLKYVFGKHKLSYKADRHKYLKTKTQFLLYRKDHEIKTNYQKKYDEKDLYTATLIPDYGSWIRFGFQKNTKINAYKYPLKNQEDEIVIQLDKINQKEVEVLQYEQGADRYIKTAPYDEIIALYEVSIPKLHELSWDDSVKRLEEGILRYKEKIFLG